MVTARCVARGVSGGAVPGRHLAADGDRPRACVAAAEGGRLRRVFWLCTASRDILVAALRQRRSTGMIPASTTGRCRCDGARRASGIGVEPVAGGAAPRGCVPWLPSLVFVLSVPPILFFSIFMILLSVEAVLITCLIESIERE
jgi:hypothetical protein